MIADGKFCFCPTDQRFLICFCPSAFQVASGERATAVQAIRPVIHKLEIRVSIFYNIVLTLKVLHYSFNSGKVALIVISVTLAKGTCLCEISELQRSKNSHYLCRHVGFLRINTTSRSVVVTFQFS